MKRYALHILTVALLVLTSGTALHAQKYPERKHIRAGNKEYRQGNYAQSEVEYRRALEIVPDMYEGEFNLANSLYEQERYEESAQMFVRLAEQADDKIRAADCFYNAGNALCRQEMYKEALEAYKQSLRINPSDMDAKFNYAYVKKLLEDQEGDGEGDDDQDQDQDNDGDGDQNQDKNQDQNQDQDQDNDDNGDQDQDQDQNKDDKNDDKPEGEQPRDQGMNMDEAEQMLEAMQAQEDRTQEKVDENKKKGVVVGSKRNW